MLLETVLLHLKIQMTFGWSPLNHFHTTGYIQLDGLIMKLMADVKLKALITLTSLLILAVNACHKEYKYENS